MCESSDGYHSPILSADDEEEWLKKAVKQIENGMNITVDVSSLLFHVNYHIYQVRS